MNRRIVRSSLAASTVVAILASAGAAMAQEAESSGGMTLPGAKGAPATAQAGDSDHDAMIGRLAVGYLGASEVAIADTASNASMLAGQVTITSLQAPVIGIRYWLDQMLGFDVGLGFYNDGGSTKVVAGATTTETDKQGHTAFLIHGGVPLSLASSKHFSFQIVPELNVGFSSSTVKDSPPPGTVPAPDVDLGGFALNVGARAGGEVHWGFIGIPELSLQAGIGMGVQLQSASAKTQDPGNGGEVSFKDSSTVITTTVNGEPWDAFTGSIAALYYF